ncbi:hypothetical protein DL546_004793 [Coniochaeta pulveracea]|uniref:GLEYA adhesin domain-containing protein n=1 Tax=Coniochaeta pulveracea TaxID=177199 RepID=A0A420YKS5_9PEZI|nr:hypothetical protein DL546_004793 [Coniochaeta pulveracea]
MRCSSSIFLSALASLAAAGCANNNCLRAIVAAGFTTRHGAADCSAYLAATVTPDTSTVTSTVTAVVTEQTTTITDDVSTTSQTTVVFTETQLITTQQTATASTLTQYITVTQNPAPSKRAVTQSSSTYPAYASHCSVWNSYVSACSCVGVLPTTVTLPTPLATTVVTETSTLTSTIPSTTSSTETIAVPETTTASTTTTQLTSVTATTLSTVITIPIPQCGPSAGRFYAHDPTSFWTGEDLALYGNPDMWHDVSFANYANAASNPTAYTWAIDTLGRLYLQSTFHPGNDGQTRYAWLDDGSYGSDSLRYVNLDPRDNIDIWAGAGLPYVYVYACVDPVTHKLTLTADGGRTRMLACGGDGPEGIELALAKPGDENGCSVMQPLVVKL